MITKILKPIILFLILLNGSFISSFGQIKYQVYAEYLYYFAENTKFPHDKDSGNFIIGVIGTENLYVAIQNIAFTKKLDGRSIVVKQFTDIKHAENCHILFVESNQQNELIMASVFSKKMHVLLVSECKEGCQQGSTINFIKDKEGIKFEFNDETAKKQHLKINADLSRLAIPKK